MKDKNIIWFAIPLILILTLITDIVLNCDIANLNRMIIDYVPYPNDNITCLGCCSLKCLEITLMETITLKNLLPFFSVGLILVFIIIIGITSYFEIQKEKEVLN